MKLAAQCLALATLAVGLSIAGHAGADDPVDVDTAKKLIGAKLTEATRKAEANCAGIREKDGSPGPQSVGMTLLVSHEGHTRPIDFYLGFGATARCVAGYFTFDHAPFKGPDVKLNRGVQFKVAKN